MSLPTADELFRGRHHHTPPREMSVVPDQQEATPVAQDQVQEPEAAAPEKAPETPARKPSGRVRHDEKMTVYVTADELLDLEHARLSLRRHQGLGVDRGRLIREAIAIALEDLEANGDDSVLVKRLNGA